MSQDPEYGYSSKTPIRVQSNGPYGGPGNEISYFRSLLDAAGKPLKFRRLGSGGDEQVGHEEDLYEIETSSGEVVRLWICMYHPDHDPDDQPPPVGFYKIDGEQDDEAGQAASAPDSQPAPPFEVELKMEKGSLSVEVENTGKSSIYLQYLGDKEVGVAVELWALGRGIRLYSPEDAAWRRASAFVAIKWNELEPDRRVQLKFEIKGLLPDSEHRDNLAKEIRDDFLGGGADKVAVQIGFKRGPKNVVEQFTKELQLPN